ncbi:molybdenum cofactor cytidylyltransferase [Dyella sp. OK004]|uniref:nucleotidyltransferase family protein n=1 Tax=Dyella sp. OK004 TaxID=1855292 RepID=UPI0008DF99C4|nr:nucleotidyltransferase family protein [Dyella sp. OK004]SFS14058.1 molybdenum cofactor cytidylyltransferase [Dyella sp. OK004]
MNGSDLHIGAVVLAAGNASRFGAAKQTLPIKGMPMVRLVAMAALEAGLSPVVVVTGAYGDAVARSLDGLAVHRADNPDWTSGMGTSLAFGVTAAAAQAASLQAVLVLLADQPAITAADLRGMLEAHASAPERILAARYEDHLGPPCIFPRTIFDELMALRGPHGARLLLKHHATCVDAYDLPSAALDIDTPADYAAWSP